MRSVESGRRNAVRRTVVNATYYGAHRTCGKYGVRSHCVWDFRQGFKGVSATCVFRVRLNEALATGAGVMVSFVPAPQGLCNLTGFKRVKGI